MMISTQSLNTLMDLVSNKMTSMDITDREDLRELSYLQRAVAELSSLAGRGINQESPMIGYVPRRGRRKKIAHAA